MKQRSTRAAFVSLLTLASACAGLVCTTTPSPNAPSGTPEVLLTRAPTVNGETLVFPPAPGDGRHARPPLPEEYATRGAAADPRVVEPSLDKKNAFSFSGRTLRIAFDREMVVPASDAKDKKKAIPAAPGTVHVSPEVPFSARWADARTLEVVADKIYDPDKEYEISLSGITSAVGKPLPAWKATFHATPAVSVAGKILDYVPVPGEHRSIAVHPSGERRIGRSEVFAVLFDQPVDLATARPMIDLTRRGDTIPVTLAHPTGPTFQGIKIDPRFVVLARPAAPLGRGERVQLTVKDRGGKARVETYDVADALETTGVSCGWGYGEECGWDGHTLKATGRQVHVTFNNPIEGADKVLRGRVTVSPPLRNLVVRNESWGEGRVVIEGAFEPSQHYQVSVGAMPDRYGSPGIPVHFTVETGSLPASLAMAEGLVLLDEASTRRFAITTRNVAEAEIEAWPVPAGDAEAFQRALERVRTHGEPDGNPAVSVSVPVNAARDRLGETFVDLSSKLAAGQSYVARLSAKRFAFGATLGSSPSGSAASELPMALLGAGSAQALAVHTRSFANGLLVHVARLASGEPVAGASVGYSGDEAKVAQRTDPMGVAWLPPAGQGTGSLLAVKAGDAERMVPLGGEGTKAKDLFPDLAAGAEAAASPLRALVHTDRGIYRPGSTVWIKASVRRPDGDRLAAVTEAHAKLHIVGPTGEDVLAEEVTTNDLGSVATKLEVPADAKLGRYQIRLEASDRADPPLARTMVQVAEFETPRFAVDIETSDPAPAPAASGKKKEGDRFRALVRGRYLFGSPMEGGNVSYTLKRRPAAFPSGPLTERGLVFRRKPRWYEEDEKESVWSRAGEGTLRADGTLAVEQAVPLDANAGPQEITLEADVTDRSNRHVAARATTVRHPSDRYAGVRVARSWMDVGAAVPVELGVIDTAGQPVSGVPVIAKLERLEYRSVQRRGAGGALRWEWTANRVEAGRCQVESAREVQTCSITVPRYGSYEISAEVAGKRGGATTIWAYHDGDDEPVATPSKGRTLEIVTDKPRYAKGDRAKLLVLNPFPAATAILAVEQGGLVEQHAVRIKRGAAVLEVPLTGAHAPFVHATVTLLPIGAKGEQVAEYRLGAVRLPVSLDDARLDLAVRTDRPSYRPGEEAEITVEVKDGAAPEAHAEITLAVVDEGVLRLTDFHVPDPVAALRPGRALDFHLYDTRRGLAELFEKSHVPGDGGGDAGPTTVGSTRKNFVETALWRPDLRTDASGRASVRFKLPDNLTQFRVMAVALDDEGKGASREGAFTVNKPVMAVPVVPRFAAVGDHLEVATMVHNETGAPLAATVTLGNARTSVTLPASGQTRVGFPFHADSEGDKTLAFSVEGGDGHVLDRVEAHVRVEEPGVDERPHLAGAFAHRQLISLEVPDDARPHHDDSITVQVGEHLWPELGERLDYLLDYPHGCVEQTTSSTLPLIAARTILPRIGVNKMSRVELDKRIMAGLARLATMRTTSGGLAYWPGGSDPNVFGTAYAIRAVVLAQKAGLTPPRGLLEGMTSYLEGALLSREHGPEVRAAIAQSLADLGKLPQGAADALMDAAKDSSVFGQASLALALSTLGGQEDRVTSLLDEVEASFDEQGKLQRQPKHNDFYYYGSPARTRAQAAIALTHLRRGSRLLPLLLHELADQTGQYTTQATAFSLIALAEHLEASTGEGAAVKATLDGKPIASRDLGFGSKELRIPLSSVRGKKATLELTTEGEAAIGFMISSRWRRPSKATGSLAETSAGNGPALYRVFTDVKGAPVNLEQVKAGDVLRVAVLAIMPRIDSGRRGYLAVTDRLPAGFEAVQPDLATVASAPDLDERHPFAELLRGWGAVQASHVEMRDDRVELYFDRIDRDEVAATYLVRAVTPGEFSLPPASAELMYEPDGSGYSEGGRVVVR